MKMNIYIYVCVCIYIYRYGASLVAELVKNLLAMQETPVRFLGQEVPLGER